MMKIADRCPICFTSTIACDRCSIKALTKENQQLKVLLLQFQNQVPKVFDVPDMSSTFEEDTKYLDLPIYKHDILDEYMGLTLTFDPSKFGRYSLPQWEKQYIFYALSQIIKAGVISRCTGSFEFHKDGRVHAHVLFKSRFSGQYVQDAITPYFTDNKSNKRAVLCKPAKFPNIIDYIKKESDHYFRYDIGNGLDDGLDLEQEPESEILKKPDNKKIISLFKLWERSMSTQVSFNNV